MTSLSFILLGAICFMFAPKVSAMQCNGPLGVPYNCPIDGISNEDDAFCCATGVGSIQKCCDAQEFLKENAGIVVGVAIGIFIFVLLIILCCCCFCSCCCLAKRRTQRGHVIYGPPSGAQVVTAPLYPVIQHSSPDTQAYSPYNPNYALQPSANRY